MVQFDSLILYSGGLSLARTTVFIEDSFSQNFLWQMLLLIKLLCCWCDCFLAYLSSSLFYADWWFFFFWLLNYTFFPNFLINSFAIRFLRLGIYLLSNMQAYLISSRFPDTALFTHGRSVPTLREASLLTAFFPSAFSTACLCVKFW